MAEDAEDTVAGGAGEDTLEGVNDTISGAEGNDTVEGGEDTSGKTSSQDGGEDTSKGGDDSVSGAPENYEDFTLPEGVELDEQAIEAFKPVAKELGLSQEGAQKLVDLYISQQGQQAEAFEAQKEKWAEEAKSDKEIGGAVFDQSVSLAKKAMEKFGTPELTAALEWSGLGSHPEIIRAFSKIGKEISEDGGETGGQGGAGTEPTQKEINERFSEKSLAALKQG